MIQTRRFFAVLLAAVMLFSLAAVLGVSAEAVTDPFPDVPSGKRYTDAVQYCHEKGYVSGYEDKTFQPNKALTRAEMAVIVDKVMDLSNAVESKMPKTNTFVDVPAKSWYTDSVLRCVQYGLMAGYDKTHFGSRDSLTREMAAVILSHVAGVNPANGRTSFADDANISSWAVGCVKAMSEKGLLAGTGNNRFEPKTALTRAMLCVILHAADKQDTAPDTGDRFLVDNVKVYQKNGENGKWAMQETRTYEYDRSGYPEKITTLQEDTDPIVVTNQYTYANGKPASRKSTSSLGTVETVTYENGNITTIVTTSEGFKGTATYTYDKGNDAYFDSVFFDNATADDSMKEEDTVEVTTKNGYLKKTVNSGRYSNTNPGDEEEWMLFNGTYTANYDDNGILESTSVVYREGPPVQEFWTLKMSGGQVLEAVHSTKYDSGAVVEGEKYVFTYSTNSVDKARYATMINSLIIGSDNNFYRYTWY